MFFFLGGGDFFEFFEFFWSFLEFVFEFLCLFKDNFLDLFLGA